MADARNLGWKLASVLRGTARPELLHTYSEEPQAVAQEVIDLDRELTDFLAGVLREAHQDLRWIRRAGTNLSSGSGSLTCAATEVSNSTRRFVRFLPVRIRSPPP